MLEHWHLSRCYGAGADRLRDVGGALGLGGGWSLLALIPRKKTFELGHVEIDRQPLFTDGTAEVKFASAPNTSEKRDEKTSVKTADGADDDDDDDDGGLTAAAMAALEEGKQKEDHAEDAKNVVKETDADPVVFFGPDGASQGTFKFAF
ncbi:hypothetical protein BU25DRAFT_466465 [Macroventuria anomochaeta]|uniref:Uncharacterized protein n=1 Tax=Macroventuria anomochaeta TaxID=301207 RepID=A0ACB6S371_9PLEO|nr:uncharacterized protein BU25DRAFT_466465 [Macroventuria anomochaeta]KAF2628701.1 hypothetical protein BU25DRAFT_466465 [Macroventuria anomochaeta]